MTVQVKPQMLSEMEDRLLAMSQGEQVTIHLAQAVLSSWFEVKLSKARGMQMALRLAKLHLIHWRYISGHKAYFSHNLPRPSHGSSRLSFRASPSGERFLACPV